MNNILKKLLFPALIIFLNGCGQNPGVRLNYQNPSIILYPNFSYSQYYAKMYPFSDFDNSYDRNMFFYDPSLFIVKPDLGYLKVDAYTYADQFRLEENSKDIIFLPYKIYHKNGRPVENRTSLHNSLGIIGLPKGEYVVVVHTHNSRAKSFLVKIEPGMITEIEQSVLMALANK